MDAPKVLRIVKRKVIYTNTFPDPTIMLTIFPNIAKYNS